MSIILFRTEEAHNDSIVAIENLCKKLRLPENYEFHCSSNSTRPQTEFLKLLSNLDFRFITVVIHKNDFKRTASYVRMSRLVIDEIKTRFPRIRIEMDSNPTFYAELRKRTRELKLKNIKIREKTPKVAD